MSESNTPTPPVEPTPPGYDPPASAAPPSDAQVPRGNSPYQPPTPPAGNPYGASVQQPTSPQQGGHQQPPYPQPPYPQPPYSQQPYSQPPYPQQGLADPASTVTMNYWLSVFFDWIPALIFFLTEKGRNGLSDEFNKANLNFSILRVIAMVLAFIPALGIIFGVVAAALFIIHIVAAVEAPKKFRKGELYKFPFNVTFIK